MTLNDLPQNEWQAATVDMTTARRPDGSGGPLSEDERIDDIQFYIPPHAELWIDDIVLYDQAPAGENRRFPSRFLFTGWFDTGTQEKEWPAISRSCSTKSHGLGKQRVRSSINGPAGHGFGSTCAARDR